MQTVTIRLDSLEKVKIPLGFMGENLHRRVIFVCDSMFKQYPSAVAALAIVNPAGVMYPGILTREGNNVLWDIRDSDVAVEGNGEIQLTFTEDTHVAKEYKCKTHITESIVPNSPAPDPVQDWLDYASGLIDGIPDDIAAALAEAKASGEFDGVGIASITKTGTSGLVDTYTITLDNGGSYDFTVTNGQKGDDGVGIQSIEKTSTVGLVDTYTVTLTNGQTYNFTVTNGQNGVEIDDTTPAQDKVFSSTKVAEMNTQLLNHIHGIEENKAPIIKNKLSGNPVVFYDGINGVKLSEIIVHFNPVQEGTGTPSDENVRNVDLWDGITVYNSGSDTSNPNETEIDWSLSGSIVGGKINLITGEIYKTYEIITAKWGDIKGSVNQTTGLASGKMTFANEVEQSTSQSAYTNGLTYCNVCATIMWKGDNFSPAHYYISSDFKTVWVAFPDNMDSNQIIQIVGKLKTPIKVATLTPVEISTLSGINKIWSDATGNCEIQYSADTEQFIRQRTNGYVTPEMYGAVGDGTTDDTNAITKAIWSGKRVIMDGVYYCTDLYLPENSEIEIHGSIKLHGTIYINKQNIDISGNGTIQAYATNTFMISPRANTIISNIKIRGLKITGDNSKTCFAITNTEANGGICFVSINCDIHDFLYGVHSYAGSDNGTWFSAMAIDGTIRECVMAIHFDWMGTGSYIQSMIQPKVNASKTDDRPLVSISSNCIVTSMMWDYGQANNKIMLRITGINNKVLSALPHSVMDVAQGVNSYEAGYILPLRQDAFGGISNVFCGDNVEKALPMNMPYDNTNDIGYMAGNNKVQVTVDPNSQESNVIDLLSSKANGLYIPGNSIQELTITFDFPESMPLREMFVAGQNMPKSVLFEYKDTNGTYHELVERERGVDYSSASGQSAYAYWQFMYGTLQFTDNFANGVRITINSDDEVSYTLTRIYIGVARVLMPNKYGDDLVATSLKIKDGNDYYTLSIQNGQVVATLDT